MRIKVFYWVNSRVYSDGIVEVSNTGIVIHSCGIPRFRCATLTALIRLFVSHTGGVVRPKIHGLGNAWVAQWSGQWSHYGLIRGQSLENGLENGRTTVWSEGKAALWSYHRSHESLDNGRSTIWTEGKVALWSDHRSHGSLDNGRTTVWSKAFFEQNIAVVSEKSPSPVKNRLFEIFQYDLFFTLLLFHSGLGTGSGGVK